MYNLWNSAYDLLYNIIGSGAYYEWAEYTCQILATVLTVMVFMIPIWLFIRVIKLIFTRG